MRIEKLKEIVLFLIAVILTIFIVKYLKILNIFKNILIILIPVFIGFVYAWLINPLVKYLSLKYKKRNLISIILFLIIIVILGLFLYFLIPTVYKEISEVIEILPELINNLENTVRRTGISDTLFKIGNFLVENVPIFLLDMIKKIFKYLGVVGIGLILGLYLSMDYEKIVSNIYKLVPKKCKCVCISLMQNVSDEVRKCINGTLLVAFIVFFLSSVSFFIVDLEAPLLIGILCGLTDLIPYIGPYIGGGVAVLVGFTESKKLGLIVLVICIIVQSIENYILQPYIMSKSIKISPVLIIIGLLVFSNLFGIVGMILATPFVAMIKVIVTYFNDAYMKCRDN